VWILGLAEAMRSPPWEDNIKTHSSEEHYCSINSTATVQKTKVIVVGPLHG